MARNVVERERIRAERRLPVLGEVLVAAGDAVEPWTVVAKAEQVPGDPYVVDLLPGGRRGAPDRGLLERALQVAVGDVVAEDEVIAHLPGHDVRSPVAGRVEFISLQRGWVLVREDPKSAQPVLVIDAARQLGVWPAMLPMYMVRRVGEQVARGAVIAAAPGARGTTAHVMAPAAGTIERVDTRSGYVYLVRPVRSAEVRAYLRGQVAAVLPGEGAVVEAEATLLRGVYGVGGERWGELLLCGEGDLDETAFGEEARGKVVAAPGRVTAAALRRARAVEAAGVVAGSCRGSDLAAALGREPGSVTGREDLPYALLLTEGFGQLRMDDDVWALLRGQSGRVISLSGATQVRAGAIRPHLVLYAEAPALRRGGPLAVGGRVRVVRGRYMGRTGLLRDLPAEPRPFPSGAVLAAARVELAGEAEPVWLPRANLEAVSPGA
jgi:hypothetical protein